MKADNRLGILLFALLLAYSLASLWHFSHNAIYLERYPNMPVWITRSGVMAAWLAVCSVGALGAILLKLRFRLAGLIMLGIYAALGFDGLAHYCLAPIAAHSFTMNFTIWTEVLAGAALLCAVTLQALRDAQSRSALESMTRG